MKRTLLVNNILYYFTLLTFACLAYGFLWSRVFYSIGLLFIGVQFLMTAPSIKSIVLDRYFLLALSIPFINLLRDGANNIFFINLTIPLYVAFYLANRYKDEWVKNGFLISSLVFLITAFITSYNYFSDLDATIGLYKIAQVVDVGSFNDHIRYSIVVSLSLVFLWYIFRTGQLSKLEKRYAKFYFLFMLFFLHLLAARTGLILFYTMALLLIVFTSIESKKYWRLSLLFIFPLLPLISYYIFPSFYHRVGYTFYDFQYYKDLTYREGSSDGIRFYSIWSGLDLFHKNPLWGVGFDGMKEVSNNWYMQKFPSMREEEMMLPHNQYLVYAAAAGFLGLTTILFFLLYPLSRWKKLSGEGRVIILGFLIICLIEVFFDSQLKIYAFGMFIPLALLHMPKKETTG